MKSINEVIQGGLENGEEADADEDGGEDTGAEGHGWRGGPGEDEESCGEDDGAEDHWGESCFGDGSVAVLLESVEVVALVC